MLMQTEHEKKGRGLFLRHRTKDFR